MPAVARTPTLTWNPGPLAPARPLASRGALEGSPFANRATALAAATQAHAQSRDAFLLVGHGGRFEVLRYGAQARTHIDGKELSLATSPGDETWLIDAVGTLHRLDGQRFHAASEVDFFQPVQAPGRLPLPSVPAERQVNHGRNVAWTPRFAFRPGRDIEQLVEVMKFVSTNLPPDVKVKAGGSRHAWSAAAATDGVYIHPEGMAFLEPVEGHPELMRVGSGTRIRELNQQLWARGLSLPVLGGFDGQTVGGVLPTGTHGSVLSSGPLAERLVRSLDLVTPAGEKVRLEPSGGITEPAAFARSHPGWKLMQGDDAFNAALINLGTFGVVHSYVLAPVERFHLKEVRTATTGREAQATLAGGNLYRLMQSDDSRPPTKTFVGQPARAYHLELLWNVHTDKMVVTSRQPVPKADEAALIGGPGDDARPSRDLFRTLSVPSEFGRPRWATVLFDKLNGLVAGVTELSNELLPKNAPKLIDGLLDMMPDPGGFIGRSYNVFNIGDGANQLPAQSATLSVPLAGDQYLEAMDVLRATAADYAAKHGQYQTGPISLRFVKGSKALLGDPVDVCKFEIIFSGNDAADVRHARALTAAYDAALRARFGDAVHFHFGQLVPDDRSGPPAGYPGLERFRQVQREFDPSGRMLNDWQRSLFPQA